MKSLFTFVTPAGDCAYLPGRTSQMRYEIVAQCTAGEYAERMQAGWRRFGFSLFRPECADCSECRSLRVDVAQFRPSDSQKRAAKANRATELSVGAPTLTAEKLELYDRFHQFQAGFKGWPDHGPADAATFAESFTEHPFPTEEWTYRIGGRLAGVGFVDALPGGLSAIYFFYDPEFRPLSLGTYNVMCVLESARRRKLPWVYLGFFVAGCRSLEYKASFRPNQVLRDGAWEPFRA
jgi:leucyl-tRNA---protein transferase